MVEVIENRPPVVTSVITPLDPVVIGGTVNASCLFDDPDTDDTHTVNWTWGDGSSSDGTVVDRAGTGSHSYSEPGIYTVGCEITDSYGESDSGEAVTYVVIFDPDGGFVTGGGWIESPENAYLHDLSLVGKANFGFVAKYKKGATVPTGSTEFQFHAGDLNFHSNEYDWLVVAGHRAQFKGMGTLNGESGYRFMLTAIDGKKNDSVDAFRIKIWEDGAADPIYDNKRGNSDDSDSTTEVSGGSIVIHIKGKK